MTDHFHKHPADMVVHLLQLFVLLFGHVSTFQRKGSPDLRLRALAFRFVQLVNKRGDIATPSATFCDRRTNSSGSTPDLVSQRIRLFAREALGKLEEATRSLEG